MKWRHKLKRERVRTMIKQFIVPSKQRDISSRGSEYKLGWTTLECIDWLIVELWFQVENILFDGAGVVKLCDFGSATTESYQPLEEWNALRRTQLEEEVHFLAACFLMTVSFDEYGSHDKVRWNIRLFWEQNKERMTECIME